MHYTKKRRWSIVWKTSEESFREIVKNSKSKREIANHFGISITSSNYKTINDRIKELDIDISHLDPNYLKSKIHGKRSRIPDEDVFVKNSKYERSHLKRRIIKQNILPSNKCDICNMNNDWCGKELVLILDHINGVNNDHRKNNLRLICPNCNSQLDTHCGRNRRTKNNCIDCGCVIGRKSRRCRSCSGKLENPKMRKFNPSKEELNLKIKELNYNLCAVGRFYDVSDNAIRKRCNILDINFKKNARLA